MGAILCIQEPINRTLQLHCFFNEMIKVGATLKQAKYINILLSQNITNGCYIIYTRTLKWNTTASLFLRMSIL